MPKTPAQKASERRRRALRNQEARDAKFALEVVDYKVPHVFIPGPLNDIAPDYCTCGRHLTHELHIVKT